METFNIKKAIQSEINLKPDNSIYQELNFGMLGENYRNRISPCVTDSGKTINS